MDDEKVAAIRQRLFDASESVMGARNLVGLLTLASVSVEGVRGKLRDAVVILEEVQNTLSNEDGLTSLELALIGLLVIIILLVAIICLLAIFAVPEL